MTEDRRDPRSDERPGFGGDELLCPTCERPFGHAHRQATTADLIEPIPEKPPLLWLKVASAILGASLLLGGTALAAYRVGVSAGEEDASAHAAGGSAAEVPTATPSAETTLGSFDTTGTRSLESSGTTLPLGSIIPTGPLDSLDASLGARIQSLGQSLNSGTYGSGDVDSLYGNDWSFTLDPQTPGSSATPGGSTTPPSGGAASPSAGSAAPSQPGPGELDLSSRAAISASSVLPSARGFTYAPANLVDGRGDTCWAEGAPGYGIGQSVTFDFGRQVTITRLEVLPGYDKRFEVDRWYSNGRLRNATLRADSGTHPVSFADERRYQSVAVPSLSTRRLTIVISSAYPATPGIHSAEDTSIGEIRIFGR